MFEDMLVNPLLVEVVLGHITEDNCFRSRRCAEAGMDMLRIGDNVGMEDRMTMHPEMWRRHLKPRLAKEISVVRDYNLTCLFGIIAMVHSSLTI